MQYFFRDSDEAELCEQFDDLIRIYQDIRFFQPSPHKAPWHIQAILDADEPIVLNFWPHKAKAQRQNGVSYEGPTAASDVIEDALADQAAYLADSAAFDVIER